VGVAIPPTTAGPTLYTAPTLRLKNSFSQITYAFVLLVQTAATSALSPTLRSIQSGGTERIPTESESRAAFAKRFSIGR
jgi:hypothetical protein